jgi:FMN-dependent NADH-azoreductase
MSLFRLDASIRTEGSVSRQVADVAQAEWQAAHPGGTVVRRDLGTSPLPSDVWATAAFAGWAPAESRSPEQVAALAVSAELVDELEAAEAYLFAVPLYNFGVPAHVKGWIDLVITDPRMGAGAPQLLAGRPAILVVARGGGYGEGTPRAGWDHSTPYLQRVLSDVWGLDLHVSEVELTLAEVNPAMADLRDIAKVSLETGLTSVATHARTVAAKVAARAA